MKAIPVTKEELLKLYWEQCSSTLTIGQIYGVVASTIWNKMRRLGIPTRDPTSAGLNRLKITTDELVKLYCEDGLSSNDIAIKCGVSSTGIRKRLRKAGVMRNTTEAIQLAIARGKMKGRIGEAAWNWKGGRFIHRGYVHIKAPEGYKTTTGYILEHTYIWEQVHQRKVPRGWNIHHLNGIKSDNRPENLVAMPSSGHLKYHNYAPYKKRIRQLEAKNKLLEKALTDNQLIFNIGEN